jgi:hypothetical protein
MMVRVFDGDFRTALKWLHVLGGRSECRGRQASKQGERQDSKTVIQRSCGAGRLAVAFKVLGYKGVQ